MTSTEVSYARVRNGIVENVGRAQMNSYLYMVHMSQEAGDGTILVPLREGIDIKDVKTGDIYQNGAFHRPPEPPQPAAPGLPEHIEQRIHAYPNLGHFADAFVKWADQNREVIKNSPELNAWVDECLEVKRRFPSPKEIGTDR